MHGIMTGFPHFITLFHRHRLARHCSVNSKGQPEKADARERNGGTAVCNWWACSAGSPQKQLCSARERTWPAQSSPKESWTEAADLAQNHLWQPSDSSVTATRLLGGPVCNAVSQKENMLGSASLGPGKGRQRLHTHTGFWVRSLKPRAPYPEDHSQNISAWKIIPCCFRK